MNSVFLSIRKAQHEDCLAIFKIRNDDEVLRFFFDNSKTTYEDHSDWFRRSLSNSFRQIYVLEIEKVIAGVIRYDFSPDMTKAEVSIYIAKTFWGQGIGRAGLEKSEENLKKDYPQCKSIIARVKTENRSSIKMFNACNYKEQVIEFEKKI